MKNIKILYNKKYKIDKTDYSKANNKNKKRLFLHLITSPNTFIKGIFYKFIPYNNLVWED